MSTPSLCKKINYFNKALKKGFTLVEAKEIEFLINLYDINFEDACKIVKEEF